MTELGFSLHSATHANASDQRGREALVRYAFITKPSSIERFLRYLPRVFHLRAQRFTRPAHSWAVVFCLIAMAPR